MERELRELIPLQLQGSDTMSALITANDAAEACYKLAALVEDMEGQPAAKRKRSRQIAAKSAEISFYAVTAATCLFMSDACIESARAEKSPGMAYLDAMHNTFIDNMIEAREALNELAGEANAFLDSMEQ